MLGPRQSRIVGPEGPKDAKIALIGEAPGAVEVQEGRPFVGPAGRLLDRLLIGAGVQRGQCYVTNVVKEQPPKTSKKSNDISVFVDLSKKVPIETEVYDEYLASLKEEIKGCSANIFIAFGSVPLYALTGIHPQKITKRRGSIYPCTLIEGRKVMASIHPAACLYGGDGKGMYLWQHHILMDLKKAVLHSNTREMAPEKWKYIIGPSFDGSLYHLQSIQDCNIIAFDIEVINLEVSCISFAYINRMNHTDIAISIPFTENHQQYFTPDQECEIWQHIARILEDDKIKKIGQNIIFDSQFLFRKYGIITRNMEDTMIGQGILAPDFPKGLDFITSIYTDIAYYKDEGKQYFKIGGSDRDFWLYNAKDSAVCVEAFPQIHRDIEKMGNLETYEAQRDLMPILTYMSERGIRMDTEGLREQSTRVGVRVDELNERLNRMCGYDINPNSSKQLAEYFYTVKGYAPYKKRGKGTITTDEDALKRLARKGANEASVLLEIRRLNKLKGTYLDMTLDTDGRLRTSFNPVGPTDKPGTPLEKTKRAIPTGRISSSQTIWGTGGNIQNLVPEFKQCMMTDEGYMGYEMDLSQAENRIVANIAPEPTMIEAFESGVDVHSLTGSLISGLSPEEVRQQHDEGIPCSIGQGVYTWRFWGKKANHGLNYGLGYRKFSFYYEIPENDGKYIVTRYHQAYPGVRQYHRWVEEELRRSRLITNLYGRVRLFLDRIGEGLFTDAYAQIPQSTVADKINREGLIPIYNDQGRFRHVELLNQVHDSIVFQIPVSIGWREHGRILREIKDMLEVPITFRMKEFSIPVDLKAGTRLAEYDAERSPLGNMKKIHWDSLETELEETWNSVK